MRDERGFTLIELLVTMVVTTFVFGATLSVLDVFQNENRFDQLRNENQDMARTTLDRLSRQLRNVIARTTSNGTVPGALEQAAKYEITFETVNAGESSTTENRFHAMRVRYCLDNSNPEDEILWEQVSRWTSSEAPAMPTADEPSKESTCPDRTGEGTLKPDWNSTAQVVQNITNRNGGQARPLFTYSSKETPQILAVNTDIFLNINPKQLLRPGDTELTSGISLRNANRQPEAKFTATEEGNYTVYLNASASYDPDGLSLAYKWWQRAAAGAVEEELPTTSQQYVTKAFKVGAKPIFKLKVTNPGGLSAEAEKTVTIK
jgi:prepilin-type N-terminal cleavage/methylation domain-containing protein